MILMVSKYWNNFIKNLIPLKNLNFWLKSSALMHTSTDVSKLSCTIIFKWSTSLSLAQFKRFFRLTFAELPFDSDVFK